MADKAISELIAANQVTPTDLFVLEQSGTAKKLTGQVLENWLVSFADGHGGIQSIAKTSTSGLVDTYRITLADTTTFDFMVTNGKSINSITKTGTSGLVDTYTIVYNDGTTGTYTVTNGAKGDKGDNTYTWIKYASQQPTASSHSFGNVPDDWIGIYAGASSTAPTDWQQYSWFKIKGEKGDTGEPATVRSNVVEYQVSDSGTIIPSGAWGASIPVVAQGRYLWTKITTTFNTGSSAVSYSVSRMGIDGTGSVSSVASVSPDANGNVPLTAADIGAVPSAGGAMTGELNMNGQPISGLNAPTANDQAANMGFVNQRVRNAAPQNLLDNSDFTNPVNQRGQTSYSGAVYGIDRWRGHPNLTVSVEDGGIVLRADSSSTSNLNHIIDDAVSKRLGGKVVTLAVCDDNNVITIASGQLSAEDVSANTSQIVASPDLNHFYINVYKLKTTQLFEVRINVRAGYSAKLKWVALYEGAYTAETLPEYQPKGYGAELAECQRYYQKLSRVISSGWLSSGAKSYSMPIQLAVGMRILPTASMSGYVARKHDGYSVHTGSNITAPENLVVYNLSAFKSGLVTLTDNVATAVDTNNILLVYQLNDVELSADL